VLRIHEISGMDPDPRIHTLIDPDPAIFVSDLQDVNKKIFLVYYLLLIVKLIFFYTVLWMRIRGIRMFLSLPDPDP
jgi:hypothetical protein